MALAPVGRAMNKMKRPFDCKFRRPNATTGARTKEQVSSSNSVVPTCMVDAERRLKLLEHIIIVMTFTTGIVVKGS